MKWKRGEARVCARCPALMALPRGLQQVIAARPSPAFLLRHSRLRKDAEVLQHHGCQKLHYSLFSTVMNLKKQTTPTLVPDSHGLGCSVGLLVSPHCCHLHATTTGPWDSHGQIPPESTPSFFLPALPFGKLLLGMGAGGDAPSPDTATARRSSSRSRRAWRAFLHTLILKTMCPIVNISLLI